MTNYVSQCTSPMLLQLGRASVYLSFYFRKIILEYCSIEEKSNRSNVLMEFIRRIEINASAIRSLVEVSIKNDCKPYLKLSIGLLIRSCLIDSILGLYLSALNEDAASEIVSDFNHDYVKAMPDRYEVYSDRCAAIDLDETLLKQLYGLHIEDNYPNYIDWSAYHKGDTSRTGFFKIKLTSRLTIAKAHRFLKKDKHYGELSNKLYAYYREYSQYEHFSVFAHESYTAPYDDDNPPMAKPFEYITKAIEYIGINMHLSEQIVLYCNNAYMSIVKLLAHN